MCDGIPCTGDCKNRAEVCELEITGNLSTLRCNRFPRNMNNNTNNSNNLNGNNGNNTTGGTTNGSNLLPETVRVRYVQSAASIMDGINPRFYSQISRTVNNEQLF